MMVVAPGVKRRRNARWQTERPAKKAAYTEAARIRSRTLSCAAVSATGRNSAKLRHSPLTLDCRAGNVTFRPDPLRRSQIAKPISFRPASGPKKLEGLTVAIPCGFESPVPYQGRKGPGLSGRFVLGAGLQLP